jgi:N-acetylglucosamine-6-sulfatase
VSRRRPPARRAALALLALLFGLAGMAGCDGRVEQARDRRPNVIFILADDHRHDFLGSAGHPWLRTPHLDRLAAEGVRFSEAFVTTSLCSPSRASFLTGQYAHRHGVVENEDEDLDPTTPTFPQLLQAAGYRTAFVGKWHMARWARPRPGFDRWVAFSRQGDYHRNTLNVDGAWVLAEGYVTDVLTRYALDFVAASTDAPFLLCLAHKAVHQPFEPAPRHRGLYRDVAVPPPGSAPDEQHAAAVGDYARTLAAVDESVGRIIAALEERGILDETVIVYAGDNGYLLGEHEGLWDKRVAYDTSIRVPLLVRYPPAFAAATVCSSLALNLDVAPTLLRLAGAAVPPVMQGLDLVPLARGETEREAFLYEYVASTGEVPTIVAVRTPRHKLVTYPEDPARRDELYDLARDPDERRNRLDDPRYAEVLAQLRGRLATLESETGFSLPEPASR